MFRSKAAKAGQGITRSQRGGQGITRSQREARRESSPRALRERSPAHTRIWASSLQSYEAGLPQSEEGLGAQARKAGEEMVGGKWETARGRDVSFPSHWEAEDRSTRHAPSLEPPASAVSAISSTREALSPDRAHVLCWAPWHLCPWPQATLTTLTGFTDGQLTQGGEWAHGHWARKRWGGNLALNDPKAHVSLED